MNADVFFSVCRRSTYLCADVYIIDPTLQRDEGEGSAVEVQEEIKGDGAEEEEEEGIGDGGEEEEEEEIKGDGGEEEEEEEEEGKGERGPRGNGRPRRVCALVCNQRNKALHTSGLLPDDKQETSESEAKASGSESDMDTPTSTPSGKGGNNRADLFMNV